MSFVFGESLKGYRQRAGVTQQELANEIEVSRGAIYAWESSQYLPATSDVVLRLAEALHLSQVETDILLVQAQYPPKYGNLGHDASTTGSYGYLKVKGGPDNGKTHILRKERHLLGRDLDYCDLGIHDDYWQVSRVHATVYRYQDEVYVADLTSSNGTFVDGRQISSPCLLRPGQHLLLGGETASSEVCVLEFARRPTSTLPRHKP